jgi:phosphate transport system permease protein
MLPLRFTARLRTLAHLSMVGVVVVVSLVATSLAAPLVERVLFTPSSDDQLVLAGSVQAVPREQWPADLRDRTAVTAGDSALLRQSGLAAQAGQVVRPVGSVDDPAIRDIIARDGLDHPSIRRWLDGSIAAVWPGWFVLLAPPMIVLSVLLRARLIDPLIGALPIAGYGTSAAVIELTKFCVTLALAAVGSLLLAYTIAELGVDARDSILGSYQQRNTLVVAIVMGFAVIPIIYTISEDALSAVPASLRSASLGCGATRWQTATRVVLPVAMSGVFSAVMIGLGRAAGETMIVLMATGNTPIMEWNIFSGFRTLAANIAVSMPEAPEGSTQLRVLFLGGLCLFALTFFINTLAELVRIRVRRRSANL